MQRTPPTALSALSASGQRWARPSSVTAMLVKACATGVLGVRLHLRGFLRRFGSRIGDLDLWLLQYGNTDGGCAETQVGRHFVQLHCSLLFAAGGDRHRRAKRHALEFATSIRPKQQRSHGVILVGEDVDLAPRTKCQVAEQM